MLTVLAGWCSVQVKKWPHATSLLSVGVLEQSGKQVRPVSGEAIFAMASQARHKLFRPLCLTGRGSDVEGQTEVRMLVSF